MLKTVASGVAGLFSLAVSVGVRRNVSAAMSDSAQPPIKIVALYKFVSLPDYRELREPILKACEEHGIMGSLLLASEGINGTISGETARMDAFIGFLRSIDAFRDLDHKVSFDEEHPFYRMKVKLKKEIVTMRVEGIDPNRSVGRYVEPEDWNELISDPDVVVVDTRNDYEFELGTFERAENPNTTAFTEFPAYVEKNLDPGRNKKVAMFCTGGIRCEKATAYMLQQGFEEVFHLKGGILNYIERVAKDKSLWKGECFVFDNRVSVDHDLNPGTKDLCHACRYPISEEDKQSPKYEAGICCPRCHDTQTERNRRRAEARQQQVALTKSRHQRHIGIDPKAEYGRKKKSA